MLPTGFHSRRRDRPNLRLRVDFVPRRGARFAGARRRQDDQLDGEPRGFRSVGRPNAPECVWNLTVRERAMVRRAVAVDLRERGHCAVHGIRRDVALSDAPAKCRAEPVPGFPRRGWLHVPYRPRHASTSPDVIRSTGLSRIGVAYSLNVECHSPGSGEPAFHDSACSRIVSSAASRNVGTPPPRGSHPGRWPARSQCLVPASATRLRDTGRARSSSAAPRRATVASMCARAGRSSSGERASSGRARPRPSP